MRSAKPDCIAGRHEWTRRWLAAALLAIGAISCARSAQIDPISLWQDGTQLRGANLWQRIVVPSLDGPTFLGSDHVGPPVVQSDFDRLAELGANLVILSHPGTFTERSPYRLDEVAQENLDRLIEMAYQADLYVVIALRTGPGRSDFTFYRDGAGDWYDPDLLIEDVWTLPAAQEGWIDMWRNVAARYCGHPAVVGYELMVEPNGAHIVHSIWDPDEFYPRYEGTLADWNAFYPRIVAAIREVDAVTPILVSPMGWSSVDWLPALKLVDDSRIVYTVHQYDPQAEYTHQDPGGTNGYPSWIDVDWDGRAEQFDRAWLASRLQEIDGFRQIHDVLAAVTEFGLKRWVRDAASFMADQMEILDGLGLNYALWAFYPGWPPLADLDDFDFLHGPNSSNHSDTDNALLRAIQNAWRGNQSRPSGK